MSGLLMLGLAIVWVSISVMASQWIGRRFRHATVRAVVALVAFVALTVLPLADEVIGGFQFRALCAQGAKVRLGVSVPAGRTTRFVARPSNEIVPSTAIPILHSHIEYHDVVTNELVAQHDRYVVKGGLLVRSLGMFEGGSVPLTISSPYCSGEREVSLPKSLGFNVIN